MSSCLGGSGGPTYTIDLDIIKFSSTSTRTSHSSSPSSTISESSDSPLGISTRKLRTPRKRPNQTYREAAALLAIAYPKIFCSNEFPKPYKFVKPHEYSSFSFEDSSDEVLIPSVVDKPTFPIVFAAHEKPGSHDSTEHHCQMNSSILCDGYEDFDAESILDEEIEEGVIESIMGNSGVCPEDETNSCSNVNDVRDVGIPVDFAHGYPLGLGLGLGGRFDFGFGMVRKGIAKPFRENDEDEWWRLPAVNVGDISPRFDQPMSPEKKTKKKKKVMKLDAKPTSPQNEENSVPLPKSDSTLSPEAISTSSKEIPVAVPKSGAGLLLKLTYDEVLDAWSDKGSPFSEDISGSEFSGSGALAQLAHIDLFGENGALREASVQRYKEKRRTRLFSKKIRYQVRKVNADQRPRMKGRFVRRSNSPESEEK